MIFAPTASISESVRRLAQRIAGELESMKPATSEQSPTDSLLYLGHWQDAIPRSIWVDPDLDAIDVRCWGIIRTQAMAGSAVILSLHRLLQAQLGYSKPTVSKVLFVLRLTRWISMCSELRHETGRFKGHIYAIHDSPISITDAMYLDTDYITFVKQQREHQHKQINRIARTLWQAIHDSIANQHSFLDDEPGSTSAIDDFFRRVNGQDRVNLLNSGHRVNLIDLAQTPQVNNINLDREKEEILENQLDKSSVKQIDRARPYTTTTTTSSSCSSFIIKKTTTTNLPESKNRTDDVQTSALIFPPDFNSSERELACLYLKAIDPAHRQSFLDETAAQIEAKRQSSKPIRNPVAYLAWLCNEQAKGNTLLTSLSIRYRENRERKRNAEAQVRQKQQALAQMSQPEKEAVADGKTTSGQTRNTNPTQRLRDALNRRGKPK
ncbi:STY4528 family pathogenicity island replication protein [Methylotuvimicrobium sp. KM1]|uniref:STY4528 family pathogenicity island replication protein n=1 Tax=Methylotuvimicrobium sp. KM1 TaxID=3377707 RepID=UPI00384C5C1D